MDKHKSILYSEPALNDDFFFDDQPVETLLYTGKPFQSPSPVNILTRWANGFDVTKAMEDVIFKLLINNYRLAMEEKKEAEAFLLLKTTLTETEYPTLDKLKAFIALWKLSREINPADSELNYRSAKQILYNCGNDIDENTRKNFNRILNSETADTDLYSLRAKAFEKFEAARFAEAEKIYLSLIERRFELPGTYCHLARVQLLMHDEKGARKSVKSAWKLRKSAVKYVLPRIIFLNILFFILDDRNPIFWIFRMKAILPNEPGSMQWDIDSTIQAYEERLCPQDFLFLMTLAEAIQDKDKIKMLDPFDIWK